MDDKGQHPGCLGLANFGGGGLGHIYVEKAAQGVPRYVLKNGCDV